jgi:DNA-binding NarL/FixJ family response regulator
VFIVVIYGRKTGRSLHLGDLFGERLLLMSRLNDFAAVVADDHELFRGALVEMLKLRFGARHTREAGSLIEVMGQLEHGLHNSLLTIDLGMPGMDGMVSLHLIREVYPAVRLVVISASERRDDILGALEAGVHGYIPKTLPNLEFEAALRTILEGRIFVPPALAAPTRAARPDLTLANSSAMSGPNDLSQRQRDVFTLLALGISNKQIAQQLRLAEGTVKVHINLLYRRLGARNRIGAIAAMERFRARAEELSVL